MFGVALDEVSDVDGHEICDLGGRSACQGRKEGFQMRLVALRGNDGHLGDTVIVPTSQEFIDGPLERFSTKRSSAGVWRPVWLCEPVVKRRCDHDPKVAGQSPCAPFGNKRVGPQGQMRPMVVEAPHRHDESGVTLQIQANFGPERVVQLI